MVKKYFFILASLVFVVGFTVQPCQTMEQKGGDNFKRKYQSLAYNYQDNDEPNPKKARRQKLSEIGRLSTVESHREYLQNAIECATKSILITSHGVDHQAFEDGGLYLLLANAVERGVRIYLYNIDSKDTDNQTFNFFQRYGIAYDVAYTHAKLLAIDDKKVAIGSYNWLSKANTWENATLCLSGEECREFIPLLWEDLKYYRNLQFGNIKQIRQYERNSQNQDVDAWELDHSTTLNYLHSLDSHRDFIADAFQYAMSSVVFCAPFINERSGYAQDFTKKVLAKTISRKVHIYFVCRTEDPNLSSFNAYLGALLNSPFIHLISLSDIHLKTVIVDDITIAEGSFNWLSASRDEGSEYHNHEVTLMMDGNLSRNLIQDFYQSPVGQEIIRAMPIPKLQPNRVQITPNNTIQQNNTTTPVNNVTKQNIQNLDSQRRKRWLALNWKVSVKGNTYINSSKEDGNGQNRNIVIIRSRNHSYSALIDGAALNGWYACEDHAKLAAFDFIWK
jgi:hypothetical protein